MFNQMNNMNKKYKKSPTLSLEILLDYQYKTGSYNFSVAAYKRNTENLLILNNPDLAKEYIQNWLKRWEISKEGVNSHRQSSSR